MVIRSLADHLKRFSVLCNIYRELSYVMWHVACTKRLVVHFNRISNLTLEQQQLTIARHSTGVGNQPLVVGQANWISLNSLVHHLTTTTSLYTAELWPAKAWQSKRILSQMPRHAGEWTLYFKTQLKWNLFSSLHVFAAILASFDFSTLSVVIFASLSAVVALFLRSFLSGFNNDFNSVVVASGIFQYLCFQLNCCVFVCECLCACPCFRVLSYDLIPGWTVSHCVIGCKINSPKRASIFVCIYERYKGNARVSHSWVNML